MICELVRSYLGQQPRPYIMSSLVVRTARSMGNNAGPEPEGTDLLRHNVVFILWLATAKTVQKGGWDVTGALRDAKALDWFFANSEDVLSRAATSSAATSSVVVAAEAQAEAQVEAQVEAQAALRYVRENFERAEQ